MSYSIFNTLHKMHIEYKMYLNNSHANRRHYGVNRLCFLIVNVHRLYYTKQDYPLSPLLSAPCNKGCICCLILESVALRS
ncbi:hypothetical protein XM72_c20325 [Vibrio vulnificus]|nr:hypothetical protein XM72_c20325 [Vibrio vulnificus]